MLTLGRPRGERRRPSLYDVPLRRMVAIGLELAEPIGRRRRDFGTDEPEVEDYVYTDDLPL